MGVPRRRVALLLIAILVPTAAIVGALVAVASAQRKSVGSGAKGSSIRARSRTRHLPFAVLTRPVAHSARQGVLGMPNAIPAGATSKGEVFVWLGSRGEAAPPFREAASAGGEDICLITVDPPTAAGRRPGEGGTCGPAAAFAARGAIDVSETGPSLYRQVTVLVPNGVDYVTFTDRDGTSYNLKVVNNVVINEDQSLVGPPAIAVHFTLPNGTVERASMPAPPVSPGS